MPISRSENMRRIKGKDTGPELAIRKILRELGFTGYRLHRKDLPGRPDVAFLSRRKAILIHGCFWHGHNCKIGSRRPKSNSDYWLPKLERNRLRDIEHLRTLEEMGWAVLTVWECEIAARDDVTARIRRFMWESGSHDSPLPAH